MELESKYQLVDNWTKRNFATNQTYLAIAQSTGGQVAESNKSFRKASQLFQEILSEQPLFFQVLGDLAECEIAFGESLWKQEKKEQAKNHFELGITRYQELLTRDPKENTSAKRLAWIHYGFGIKLQSEKNHQKSYEQFRSGLNAYKKLLEMGPLYYSPGDLGGFQFMISDVQKRLLAIGKPFDSDELKGLRHIHKESTKRLSDLKID